MFLGAYVILANLAVGAGIKQFLLLIEDLFVDVYFHFEKSCKCIEIFREFQDFTGVDFQKILKHCSIRWLSLLKCIQRILGASGQHFNPTSQVMKMWRKKDM